MRFFMPKYRDACAYTARKGRYTLEIIHHNKLVRDNILAELQAKGIEYEAQKVRGAQHFTRLIRKLNEEVAEVREAPTRLELLEELADVVEVCYALARRVGYETHDLERVRVMKMLDKGSFNDGDLLLTTKRRS